MTINSLPAGSILTWRHHRYRVLAASANNLNYFVQNQDEDMDIFAVIPVAAVNQVDMTVADNCQPIFFQIDNKKNSNKE